MRMKKLSELSYENKMKVFQAIDSLIEQGDKLAAWAAINNPPPLIPHKIGDKIEVVKLMFDVGDALPIGSIGDIVALEEAANDANNTNLWIVDFDCYDGGAWHLNDHEIRAYNPTPTPDQTKLAKDNSHE